MCVPVEVRMCVFDISVCVCLASVCVREVNCVRKCVCVIVNVCIVVWHQCKGGSVRDCKRVCVRERVWKCVSV